MGAGPSHIDQRHLRAGENLRARVAGRAVQACFARRGLLFCVHRQRAMPASMSSMLDALREAKWFVQSWLMHLVYSHQTGCHDGFRGPQRQVSRRARPVHIVLHWMCVSTAPSPIRRSCLTLLQQVLEIPITELPRQVIPLECGRQGSQQPMHIPRHTVHTACRISGVCG